jgi:hypothetical protein
MGELTAEAFVKRESIILNATMTGGKLVNELMGE